MGITRYPWSKRKPTGGKRSQMRKKRKYQLGRPAAMTKLGTKRVRLVRTRGGNRKFRALRLETGNFAWGSEGCTRKSRIMNVVYNASNNEFVRTNTLVKGAVIQVEATPFKQWYEQHYGVTPGGKKGKKKEAAKDVKQSGHVKAKLKGRQEERQIDPHLEEQFSTNRLYAAIASRPGQSGRADGYILEGQELDFYLKKMQKKGSSKEKDNVVSNQKPLELKLLMLGDAGVGKTSLILRYCDDYFTDTFISSMGSDFKEKSVVIEGQQVNVELYDTAGQERFRKVTSSYFRGGQGVMIVFDVNNPASFENVRKWKTEVDRYAEDEVAIVLVGNKTDLERRVSEDAARKLAAELGLPYTETSCKKPSGVAEAMLLLAKETKMNQEELDL